MGVDAGFWRNRVTLSLDAYNSTTRDLLLSVTVPSTTGFGTQLRNIGSVQNRAVTTLEGLGSTKKMHKIQQAFVDEQAVQCGYCINGMIMSTKALLGKNPKPTDSQIKEALAGNLCRCGTHIRILRAVKRASGQLV